MRGGHRTAGWPGTGAVAGRWHGGRDRALGRFQLGNRRQQGRDRVQREEPDMSFTVSRARAGGSRRQAGLSLIELMIAMVIGLVLILGLIQVFAASRQAYQLSQGIARNQENGR